MTFDAFRTRARGSEAAGGGAGARLVPVWRDCLLDADTPVAAFAKLRHGPFAFLLESAPAGGETWARYTFMGAAPRAAWRLQDGLVQDWTWRLQDGLVQDWSPERGWHNDRWPEDPLAGFESLLSEGTPGDAPDIGDFPGAGG